MIVTYDRIPELTLIASFSKGGTAFEPRSLQAGHQVGKGKTTQVEQGEEE